MVVVDANALDDDNVDIDAGKEVLARTGMYETFQRTLDGRVSEKAV